ncbi:MAG: cysteine desulfurase [Candidatus Nitronauta litoralis]|uniref:Cysteine desulfurase n=1 Tax=Candidatus Nitronauta litoralis TaxID=2705533 RepID=A0A7T0BY67_9BACT|nr:MAG: cysteine desulfurase [Candidatus Nitronauta litoralis]
MIYLDNAATTPMDPEVIEIMNRSMREDFANSGTVYSLGVETNRKLEKARAGIARFLNLPPDFNLIFTGGGSEANNLFIKGICFPNKRVASTGLDHPSVTEAIDSMKEFGNEPVRLKGYSIKGRLEEKFISELVENRVRLLCLTHVNNELGTVQPIEKVSNILREGSPQTRLFVDGVQAVGKIIYTEKFWQGLSGYSISAHKFNGPKGIGLLVYDSRLNLNPQIHGGKQQYGVRSGTLPVPLILGMMHALKLATARVKETCNHMESLHKLLVGGLRQIETEIPELDIKFNSEPSQDWARQSSAILNFSFTPVEGEVLLHHLEENKIFVGLGSACSAHSKEPSKILMGTGCTEEEALCSLRVSFGAGNTRNHVETFLKEFREAWLALYPAFRSRVVST